jgi:hypothetical protein
MQWASSIHEQVLAYIVEILDAHCMNVTFPLASGEPKQGHFFVSDQENKG